ncbi:murein hydrolase activator EnvC family protein [Dethiosulfatarculus sandiegensis]|uniref:M23ase beta-sheet core domain-containing protein n=1 Tax=Dethiosulfatarculus sandiegensis TaxID=1429043 RepID=A0A0D2J5M9_9BACT|nr:peptidoglycan DD-metalloendopeptidase family protein [Dethiosulfatarculus sandiegensis]KIX13424.1 hypothetical protein X474_14310 [Dethiosulfatarculus sandiegensis]
MRRIFFALTCLCLVLPLPLGAAQKPDSLETARRELKTRLSTLVDQRNQLTRTIEAIHLEINSLKIRRIRARARINELKALALKSSGRLEDLRREAAELQPSLLKMREIYGERLRAMYLHGPDTGLAIWAGANSFHDALTRSQALARLAADSREKLQKIKIRQKKYEKLKTSLAFKQNEFLEYIKDQQETEKTLKEMEQKNGGLLNNLEAQGKKLSENINTLNQAQARLVRTLAMVKTLPPEQKRGKILVPPIKGVVAAKGNLSPPVEGAPTNLNLPEKHGIFIKARPGSLVRSPWWGKVAYAGNLAGYGKVIVLDHGQRVHTVLACLGNLSVDKGQNVKAGSVVGQVGGTALVYLEVRKGAKPVNPLKWLRLGS